MAKRLSKFASSSPVTPRIVASVCSLEGGGKTEFACTFPDHTDTGEGIAFFSIDANSAEVVERHQQAGKNITLRSYQLPGILYGERGDIQDIAGPEWDRFLDDLADVATSRATDKPASIILDTGTVFHQLQLSAEHGKLNEIPAFERVKSNMRWESLLIGLKQSGCHVGVLHRLRSVYESQTVRSSQGTKEERVKVEGKYEREGCSKTPFAMNLEVFLYHDPSRGGELENQFGMEIVRSTTRPMMIGETRWGAFKSGRSKVSFRTLARMMYPDIEW